MKLPKALAELVATLQGFSSPVWLLVAGTFVNRFGGFVFVFLALYLTGRGFSPIVAGGAMSAWGLGSIVSTWIGGALADRYPRKFSIAVSMFGSAAAAIMLATADSLVAIVILSGVMGAFTELYRPASSALLIDLTRDEDRVTAFALNRMAINLGTAMGPMAGGLMAEHSFLLLFAGDALTSFAFGAVALALLPRFTRDHEESLVTPRKSVLTDARLMFFLSAVLLTAFVIFQAMSTLPLHVTRQAYTAAHYGLLLGLNGWIVATCELALTGWSRRWNAAAVIAAGFALLGIGMAMIGFSSSYPWMIAGMVIFTAGEITAIPVAAAWIARLAPAESRGRYMAAWTMSWAVAAMVAPLAGMGLFEWSPSALWLACALAGLVAAVIAAGAISWKSSEQRSSEAAPG